MLRPSDLFSLVRYANIGKLTYQLFNRRTIDTLVHAVGVASNEGQIDESIQRDVQKKLRRLRKELYPETDKQYQEPEAKLIVTVSDIHGNFSGGHEDV